MRILSISKQWGIESFKELPRTNAFVRVFFFLATVFAISFLAMVFKCKDFTLNIITKLDCFLAILFLYSEGVDIKQWLKARFTLPKSKRAIVVGFFLTIVPTITAMLAHYMLLGQFPIIEKIPFSGHVFGYFLMSLFVVVFEDISWRGFLMPRVLYLRPYIISVVTIGFLWGAWHIPFHLTLGIIVPDQIFTQILYYTCVFLLYYAVWTLSEGSLIPIVITHAFYNTLGHFTVENIQFLEGCSDGWIFFYFQTISLSVLVGITTMLLNYQSKFRCHAD